MAKAFKLNWENVAFFNQTKWVTISGYFQDAFPDTQTRVWINIGKRKIECPLSKSPDGNLYFKAKFNISSGWKIISIFVQTEGKKKQCLARKIAYYPKNFLITKIARDEEKQVDFAFISDCADSAYRYRCQHPAEKLKQAGFTVSVQTPRYFNFSKLLATTRVVIAHRVPDSPDFAHFSVLAKKKGIKLIFDTDDLIFNPDLLHEITPYNDSSLEQRGHLKNNAVLFHQAIQRCQGLLVSTLALKEEARKHFPLTQIEMSPNTMSSEMLKAAIQTTIPQNKHNTQQSSVLSYFSGTNTHNSDFAQCAPAIIRILKDFPEVRLQIIGPLQLSHDFHCVQSQIIHQPLVSWQKLPQYYSQTDINLAPLEPNNRFTRCKSALKYFEAALFKIPTIASNWGPFSEAIKHDYNGLVCNSSEEWYFNLRRLIKDKLLRQRLGSRAHAETLTQHFSKKSIAETSKAYSHWLKAK